MRVKWTITIIILLIGINSKAQKKLNKLNISARYHHGLIMPHNKFIYNSILSHINGAEINVGYTPKDKKWSADYSFPEIGIGFMHENLGNKEVLGSATAIFPYIDLNLKKIKKINLYIHLGLGLCYTNKKFDVVNNYKNIAISSDINAFIILNANAEYKILPKLILTAGMGANHISNGSSSRPNRGLNTLTYNMGFKAYINDNKKELSPKKNVLVSDKKKYLNVSYINGIKRATIKDPHKYYSSCLSINYIYSKNIKHKLNFGLDIFYDESTNRGTWNFDPEIGIDYRIKQGVHAAHTLCIGKLGLYTEMGVYVHSKASTPSAIYTRLGLDYDITKKIMARLSLKAHMAKADVIEFGLAYNFIK